MGCASSNLNSSGRKDSKAFRKSSSKNSISVVGKSLSPGAYFSQDRSKARVRSWSPEGTDSQCDEEDSNLEREHTCSVSEKDFFLDSTGNHEVGQGETTGVEFKDTLKEESECVEEEKDCENMQQGIYEVDGHPVLSRTRSLESPARLCQEQERRLRCANLEIPPGLADFDSDEEEEDFEFARAKGSPASCITEEQAVTPFLEGRYNTNSDGIITDLPLSAHRMGRFSSENRCSLSEPELEVLISSDSQEECAGSPVFLPSSSAMIDFNGGYQSSPLKSSSEATFDVESSPGSVVNDIVLSSVTFPEKFSTGSRSQPYFPDQNFAVVGGFFSCASSDHSVSGDFSPCFAATSSLHCSSVAESWVERDYVDMSPSSTLGLSPANDSVVDSLTESGYLDEPLSPSLYLEWQPRSSNFKWDISTSSSKWQQAYTSPSIHSQSERRFASVASTVDPYQWDSLIPGLPNDLAQLCLMRVPFVKYDPRLRLVCRRWQTVLSSEEFYTARKALGIQQVHISFVVHGNKVQVFNLQTHRWFCLPPLPKEDGNISPEWGIDPYDWWQIDTVAVSGGTLFVIGGDQAELHSFTRPSKPTNRVHKFDYCKNCWVAASPMQVPRSHAAAICLGKWIFVAGGSEDNEVGSSAEVYDFDQNSWTFISNMNSSMRMCVGMEHEGSVYVKGENTGQGSTVEGEMFDPVKGTWERVSLGMRTGLARGPIASADSVLFVADWKDSQLKMYDAEWDSWEVVTRLPARISRLVGHGKKLYGLTGKIKVDPFNHHVISDAPAEVWMLDLGRSGDAWKKRTKNGTFRGCELLAYDSYDEDFTFSSTRIAGQRDDTLGIGMTSVLSQEEAVTPVGASLLCGSSSGGTRGCLAIGADAVWECLWRDPKQMVKTGGLAWVPCIAHCTLFQD
eukprot:c28797_g1_i1 orf=466-3183(+)